MNLTTRFAGLELPHPFICGASPLSDAVEGARRLEDAGIAAITLRSLFEEQIEAEALATHDHALAHADSFGEATSYLPDPDAFVLGPDQYLRHLESLKQQLEIPVIASLNGNTSTGWTSYARSMQDAGADAIELNLHLVVTDPDVSGAEVEERSIDVVRAVAGTVTVPVVAKISATYTSFLHFARRLEGAGVCGLVVFNRAIAVDVDVENLRLVPRLGLSHPADLIRRLRLLALVSAHTGLDLAVTGGVHHPIDALKACMAGARVVQLVSTLLKEGPSDVRRLRAGLAAWLDEHEYASLEQAIGSMDAARCPNPEALSRAGYATTLQTHVPPNGNIA